MAKIPVIDIAGSATDANVAKALVDAAATYGFVYVRNQGQDIPIKIINDAFELVSPFPSSSSRN